MSVRKSQSGMASFLIVLIMMIVITLIVLGLSQVTRNNSRQALDRQLSSQAFYAAESGVNITSSAILGAVKASGYTALPTKTTCPNDYSPTNAAGGVGSAISQLGSGVRYTCVLVDPNPTSLKYNPTRQGSTVVPLASTVALKTLTFKWDMQSGGSDNSCTGNAKQFPQAASWTCDYGILRVDLLSNPNGNIANLASNTVTIYATPVAGAAAVTVGSTKAYITSASGCASGQCSVTITLPGTVSAYAARITSIYRDTPNTIITGTTNSGAATFSGAQAVVDVTGQAQDELRRLQVRVQLTAAADPQTIPSSALSSSASICKHFPIGPSDTVDPANLCQ